MSGSHRHNVNGQHDNIPNHIDYATQSNYQENTHIRNPLPEEKSEHIFWLFCINPNGISVTQHNNEFAEICHTMACFSVDMICLTEHNLHTSHHTTCQCLHQTTKTTFDHTKPNFVSSPIPSPTLFKPGGTIMMSQGFITTHLLLQELTLWDNGHTRPGLVKTITN